MGDAGDAGCAATETPAELAGEVLSPCLRLVGAQPPGSRPVCMRKASQTASCKRSWAGTLYTFGFPRGVRHLSLDRRAGPLNEELGRDDTWLPVTHTKTSQDPSQVGLWFHYMRGCSDTTWNTGRTLLTRNKCDTAVQLEMRASNVSWGAALLRLAHKLVHHKEAMFRNPRFAAPLVLPLNPDRSENVTLIAEALGRCALGRFGAGVEAHRCSNQSRRVPARSASPEVTFSCLRAKDPAISLAELNVLDFMSAALLGRELRATARALDTIQNHNRCDGQGTHPVLMKQGLCAGYVELWDVRTFSGPNATRTGRLANLSGALCEPSDSWAQCFACKGSETEEACAFKCTMPTSKAPTRFAVLPRDEIVYNTALDGCFLTATHKAYNGTDARLRNKDRHEEGIAQRLRAVGPGGMPLFFNLWRSIIDSVPWLRESHGRVSVCNYTVSAGCIELPRATSKALSEYRPYHTAEGASL